MSSSRWDDDTETTEMIPFEEEQSKPHRHPTTSETTFSSSTSEFRQRDAAVDVDTKEESSGPNERDLESELEADRRLTLLSFKEALSLVTPRALLFGWLVGALVAAMNISFGLKTGWTQGGKIRWAVCCGTGSGIRLVGGNEARRNLDPVVLRFGRFASIAFFAKNRS